MEKIKVEVGDILHAKGFVFVIAEIVNLDQFSDGDIGLEFKDPQGRYHYWKSWCDGGYIEKGGK